MNPKISEKNKAWTLHLAGITEAQLDELYEEGLRRKYPILRDDSWKKSKVVEQILEELDRDLAARELAAKEPS